MPENHMGQQALRSAQCQAADSQAREHRSENKQSLLRCRPKIVCAPAQRLRRVAMDEEADNQPYDEYYPRPSRSELQAPDKPKDECGQERNVSEREPPLNPRSHCARADDIFNSQTVSFKSRTLAVPLAASRRRPIRCREALIGL